MGGRVKWNLGEHTARTRANAPVVYACVSEHDRHVPQVLLYHGTLGDGKISIQSCRRSMGTTTRGQKDLVKIGSPTKKKKKKKLLSHNADHQIQGQGTGMLHACASSLPGLMEIKKK